MNLEAFVDGRSLDLIKRCQSVKWNVCQYNIECRTLFNCSSGRHQMCSSYLPCICFCTISLGLSGTNLTCVWGKATGRKTKSPECVKAISTYHFFSCFLSYLISKSCYERQCFNWWLSFAARDLYSIQTGWISLLTDISDIVRTRLDVKY